MYKVVALVFAGLLTVGLASCSSSAVESVEEKSSPLSFAAENTNEVTIHFTGKKNDARAYEDETMLVKSTIASIAPVTDDELAELTALVEEEKKQAFDALDFHKIIVNETYVKGVDPLGRSSWGNYRAITSQGKELHGIEVIGVKWCEAPVYNEEFITGEEHSICILSASQRGKEAPGGVKVVKPKLTAFDESNEAELILYDEAESSNE